MATAAAAARPTGYRQRDGCVVLARAPSRIAARRSTGGATVRSFAATVSACARAQLNHAPGCGSSRARRSASTNAGSPAACAPPSRQRKNSR